MIKKLVSVFLSLSIAVTLLAGCGGEKENAGESSTAASSTVAAASSVTEEPKHYDVSLAGYPVGLVEKDSPVEKLLEEKFNVSIDAFSVAYADYNDKLSTLIAGGDIPDVFFSFEPQNWQPLVEQGILAEVPVDTIKKSAPEIAKSIDETDATIWSISSYKGKNWAVPKISGNEYNTAAVWRLDWLKKVGITEVPKTLQDYEAALTKFREGDPDGNNKKDTYGFTGQGGHATRLFDAIFGAYGILPGQWRIVDGKPVMSTIMPEAKEALTLLKSWYDKGLIDPEFITDNPTTTNQKFDSGRIGLQITNPANYHPSMPVGNANIKAWKDRNPNAEFVQGPIPAGPEGKRGDWLWGPRGNFVVFGEQLSKEPDKLDRILKMLDTVYSDEETALRVYWGEKGKTYDFNDPAVGAQSGLKYLPPYDTDPNAKAKEGIGDFFQMFRTVYDWASPAITGKYMPQDFKKFVDENASWKQGRDAIMRAYLPSASQYQADLDKLKVVAYSEFITGKRDLKDWDKFTQEWLSKGGQKLTEEAQKFYDENVKPYAK